MKRKIGEVINYENEKKGRKWIVTEKGWEINAVYVAKQNPDICGKWFEGCEVHHKDGNRFNDQPENLICLTPQEHRELHKNMPHPSDKPITVYFEGENCGTYPSIQRVTEALDIPRFVISHYLKKKTPIYPKWKEYSFEVNT